MENVSPRARQAPQLSVGLACCDEDIAAAQRLRWQIFAEEQGVALEGASAEMDVEPLDGFCDHLIVRQVATGQVVGTCRLLTSKNALAHGGYYSEREFEIGPLLASGRRLLEIGRSCVHREHRNGSTIALLWSGIAAYQLQARHDAIIGCASIPLGNDIGTGAALAYRLATQCRGPEFPAVPRRALPLPPGDPEAFSAAVIPPLIKGYLRCGAIVCGAPYWDEGFNTADLFMYMAVDRIEARYARHFLKS
ncbi:MAG: GNAT family N-acetyltransferase [Alphaproteobacteria bacterium]|nr:GNAT family N-acetyltransferase [Alphaproteobacteria bacterium]